MNNKNGHSIYFLGIGGIGMSALARYYHAQGCTIAGYDRTPSPLTKALEAEGISVHYEDKPELLPEHIDSVIYTPAVPKDLNEIAEILRRGLTLTKRSEALGEITRGRFTFAVAGTHGKTTTTAMLSHILKESGKDVTAFIGGIANNFNSNLLLGKSVDGELVVEADEFDRSFLHLSPDISIINSIDADHLDIYGDRKHLIDSFNAFAALTSQKVIYKEGLPVTDNGKGITFGLNENCDGYISDIKTESGVMHFNIRYENMTTAITLPMPGVHNAFNATAAFLAARLGGIPSEAITKALLSFKGVKRRLDIRVNNARYCYIDDYAHHPEEIKSCLSAIRLAFPTRKITLIFQPHLFTRTRDFMEEFAKTLAMADELILLDIYPAREKPLPGISSSTLLDKVQLKEKSICSKEELLTRIGNKKPELLVTMGAGDIDRFVEPLEKMIQTW